MKTLDTMVNELETTIGAETGRDPFWGQAEIKLLRALVSYVKEARPAEKQNPDEVLKILLVNEGNLNNLLADIPNDIARAVFASLRTRLIRQGR